MSPDPSQRTATVMLASGLPSSRAVAHESRYRPGSSVASCAAAKVRAVFDDRILRAWPRSGAGATPTATSSPPSDQIGRAHVCTHVTHEPPLYRTLLKKKITQ